MGTKKDGEIIIITADWLTNKNNNYNNNKLKLDSNTNEQYLNYL